jgi:glycosyltransferase involved in cell wall biosynthesis
MRVAVIDLAVSGWLAGSVVSRTLALGLISSKSDILFASGLSDKDVPLGCSRIFVPTARTLPGENTLRALLKLSPKRNLHRVIDRALPDVVLPFVEPPIPLCPTIGWIPDFQHRALPDLFQKDQQYSLDNRHKKIAERCCLVWCSSEAVANDFKTFFPYHAHKARVASFPSLFAYERPGEFPADRPLPYRLPARFLLVVNQFWAHKNHKLVAEALGLLRSAGLNIPTVMVGMPADHRDKQNTAVSETLQELARNGSWPDCLVLGKIESCELLQLLRSATALVQPSRFEGWNTTVEDAKALGCPVILSDLDVHHEQCPNALGFFGCDDPQALAEILVDNWEKLPTRPDFAGEEIALLEARKKGLAFGIRMREICQEACS